MVSKKPLPRGSGWPSHYGKRKQGLLIKALEQIDHNWVDNSTQPKVDLNVTTEKSKDWNWWLGWLLYLFLVGRCLYKSPEMTRMYMKGRFFIVRGVSAIAIAPT